MSDIIINITVDMRETSCEMPRLLQDLGARVEIADLHTGDYILAPDICCERKTAQDFIGSIFDKRLFSQVVLMKAEFSRPVFIIEGNVFSTTSAIEPAALAGALSYLHTIEGISVFPTRNTRDTAHLLFTIARHALLGLGYCPALRGDKPKDTRSISQYIAEGLPSVGPDRAKLLLSHFGSAHAVFNASEAALLKVPGIGKTVARKILEAIHAPYGEDPPSS